MPSAPIRPTSAIRCAPDNGQFVPSTTVFGSPSAVNAVPLVHVPDAVTDTVCPAVTVTPVACHIAVSGGLAGGAPFTTTSGVHVAAGAPHVSVSVPAWVYPESEVRTDQLASNARHTARSACPSVPYSPGSGTSSLPPKVAVCGAYAAADRRHVQTPVEGRHTAGSSIPSPS